MAVLFLLLAAGASAQRIGAGPRPHAEFRHKQVTPFERMQIRKDMYRNKRLQRKAQRDGIVTPREHRQIRRSKRDTRHDVFRYRHNPRRRLI